jgi:hypothetical protein
MLPIPQVRCWKLLISYQKYRKEEFDTDLENFGEESEWDSEDEWTSEEGAEDDQVAGTSELLAQ